MYLGMCVSRLANRSSSQCFWDNQGENVQQVFARQALSMSWDYVEGSPFSESSGNFLGQAGYLIKAVLGLPQHGYGQAATQDAAVQELSDSKIVSTDPPYYDNIGYADLSDFFYVWLKRTAGRVYPELFRRHLTDKTSEAVANVAKFDRQKGAKALAARDYQQRMAGIFAECRRGVRRSVGVLVPVREPRSRRARTSAMAWSASCCPADRAASTKPARRAVTRRSFSWACRCSGSATACSG